MDRLGYQKILMPIVAEVINKEILLGEQNQYNDNSGYVIRDNESKTGLLYSFVYLYEGWPEDSPRNIFYEIEFLFTGEINLLLESSFHSYELSSFFQKFKKEVRNLYIPEMEKLKGKV